MEQNFCRVCFKFFCCFKCRMKHEIVKHHLEPLADCSICRYGRIYFNCAIKDNSDLIIHIKEQHPNLHCHKCKMIFDNVTDVLTVVRCEGKSQNDVAHCKSMILSGNNTNIVKSNDAKSLMTTSTQMSVNGNIIVRECNTKIDPTDIAVKSQNEVVDNKSIVLSGNNMNKIKDNDGKSAMTTSTPMNAHNNIIGRECNTEIVSPTESEYISSIDGKSQNEVAHSKSIVLSGNNTNIVKSTDVKSLIITSANDNLIERECNMEIVTPTSEYISNIDRKSQNELEDNKSMFLSGNNMNKIKSNDAKSVMTTSTPVAANNVAGNGRECRTAIVSPTECEYDSSIEGKPQNEMADSKSIVSPENNMVKVKCEYMSSIEENPQNEVANSKSVVLFANNMEKFNNIESVITSTPVAFIYNIAGCECQAEIISPTESQYITGDSNQIFKNITPINNCDIPLITPLRSIMSNYKLPKDSNGRHVTFSDVVKDGELSENSGTLLDTDKNKSKRYFISQATISTFNLSPSTPNSSKSEIFYTPEGRMSDWDKKSNAENRCEIFKEEKPFGFRGIFSTISKVFSTVIKSVFKPEEHEQNFYMNTSGSIKRFLSPTADRTMPKLKRLCVRGRRPINHKNYLLKQKR